MMTLTLRQWIELCRAQWQGEEAALDETPAFLTTDSRAAAPGCLFAALRGERTDGHRYIPDVLAKGALAVLAEEEGAPGEPRLVVKSVMEALRLAAAACRQRDSATYIGVTGSVGKTTTKEMTAAILGARFSVYKTPGNLNGQLGVPMSLLNMAQPHEAAVIEMGISQFGEMRRLTEIVRPHMAVFTNIGHAHLEFLHDRDGVLAAKGEILEGMDEDGVVICNGDDDKLRAAHFPCRKVCFGLDAGLDVRAENIRAAADHLSQQCEIVSGSRRIGVTIPSYGEYMVYAVLAGAAVALELGLSDEEIARGVGSYQTMAHRSRIVETGRFTLVDDCYNANPDSTRAAIRSLRALPGRHVCILGDMLEMGPDSARLHREVGAFAAAEGAALVLSTGAFAGELAAGAGECGMACADKAALIRALPALLRDGDSILVKASRGARFEEIVDAIEAMGP